jgi:NADPH:quinone reductase
MSSAVSRLDIEMKALVFDHVGPPLDVLQLRDIPTPSPKAAEVLVKLDTASINPGDFLFIQSLYPEPKKPSLPQQTAGTGGGVGVVVESGGNTSLPPGTAVAFSYYNAWAEYAALPAEWLIPLPSGYPAVKAAQFANIITAWDLFEMSHVVENQWLIVTAANSAVATMVLQLAQRKGVRVVCIVRRAQADFDLRALGANAVIQLDTLEGGIDEAVKRVTDGRGADAIIDCVGGPQLGDLIRSVARGAQVIVYGGLSAERFELHAFDLLMNVVDIRTYAYRYFFAPPSSEDLPWLHRIVEASAADDFKVRVGGLHKLEDFRQAITETIERPEYGKRFFSISENREIGRAVR